MPIMPTGEFITRADAADRLRMDERMAELIRRGGRERGMSETRIAAMAKPFTDDAAMMEETLA